MQINKILYIGCGTHLDIISHFPNTQQFVLIDTQPLSEFDASIYYKPFYRPNFINIILLKLKKLGFMIQNVKNIDKNYYKKIFTLKQRLYYLFYKKPLYINPCLLTFYNTKTKQTVKYYVSTDIQYTNIMELHTDIKTCDSLLVSGHPPSIEYLKYFSKPINFIGYSNTIYHIDIDNKHSEDIIQYFHRNKSIISQYILSFFVVDYANGKIEVCMNFDHFIELSNKIRYDFNKSY